MRLLAVPFLFTLLAGCGGPPTALRQALLVSTEAFAETDRVYAGRYTAEAAHALGAATTLVEYRAAMASWDDGVAALRVAQSALRALDAALDGWDAGGSQRWLALAGCVVEALAHVAAMLETAGLEVPEDLREAVDLFGGLGAAACEE